MRADIRSVPEASTLTPTTRWDVRQAWLSEAHPGDRVFTDLEGILRRDLLAVDQGALAEVVALVQRLRAWLEAAPDEAIEGELTPLGDAHLVTLYLASPDRHWPALAFVEGKPCLAFGGELVLVPAPVS